jgi:ubiquinone/menaquinone biosynthesis C-methylase UbiE
MSTVPSDQYEAVNRAFTKQALHFDADDLGNPILQNWRKQIYKHVGRFIKPYSTILELNAGTGIDALYFAQQGHRVHATDLSDGMIEQIKLKAGHPSLNGRLTYQQLSFENLDLVKKKNFDFIFSNFGGLNCIDDLNQVTKHFPALLKTDGYVTLVIMPPVCLWEFLSAFKGNKKAFRRFNKNGAQSHLEGEYFQTFYHSLPKIKSALGSDFKLLKVEGLGSLSPPPSRGDFPTKHPAMYNLSSNFDSRLRKIFPFNRCGDHIIVTQQFQLLKNKHPTINGV